MDTTSTSSTLCTRAYAAALFAAVSMLPACSSVPGETMSSGGMQRDVRDRVIAMARAADPQCRQQTIVKTEMLEVHPDGKSAEELWTVEQCGRRVDYVVSFPQRRGGGKSLGFSVRPQR